MAEHLANHLKAGQASPGVFVLRAGCKLREVLECLELAAHAGKSSDYANVITFIP